ncbi:outer membrane beta-barrel protein [Flagellimonas sp. DF-77]|uniref:outer membrane beta-barrel protein n=1 Tax=Flagellimonas algarum TaxID=3230298 RepID=UPI003394555E
MEKNNFDKLFKKKFENFAPEPDDRVWRAIENSLDKKQKRRVVPIWWRLGGVAALLALLLYVINPFDAEPQLEGPSVSDTELQNKTDDPNSDPASPSTDATPEVLDGKAQDPEASQVADVESTIEAQNGIESVNARQTEDKGESTKRLIQSNRIDTAVAQQTEANQQEARPASQDAESVLTESIQETNPVAANRQDQGQPAINATDSASKNPPIAQGEEETTETAVAETTIIDKQSIYDAIEAQEEDAVAEESDPTKRWSVGPSIAPVYFDALGEGSPIHSNFQTNSKSGKINLSYGLTVAYNLTKKLSVRSGIHKVDYGYDTNEVVFSSSLQASTNQLIDNINYSRSSRNLVVQSVSKGEVAADAQNPEFSAASASLDGRMVQQLGYIEVPMEFNYAILDKKLGVNLIGGVSSLFLVDNMVSLESGGLVTDIGQANNVNDVNFSTNVGIGINYEFSQNLQLNVEPMFKYQLNTFTETAGDFRPYAIGVYSGVRYRF